MIVYFLIALGATIIGSLAGLGGGLIIKPFLQVITELSLVNINILSSITVFSMSITALIKRKKNNTFLNIDNMYWLILGSLIGGILGNRVFNIFITSVSNEAIVEKFQTLTLIIILTLILVKDHLSGYPVLKRSKINFAIIGICLATLSSFLGIGGGPINVALLIIFFKFNIKEATFLSILIIFFSQTTNLISYKLDGAYLENYLKPLIVMIPAAIAGGILGSKFSHEFDARTIHRVFNIVILFLIIMNAYILINI